MNTKINNTKYFRLNHQEILDDYKKMGDVNQVAVHNKTSKALVDKVLLNYGVEKPKKIMISDLDPTSIVNRYLESRNSSEVAQEFSISISSLYQILNNNNVKISKIKYTEQEIIDHYYKVKTLVKTCEDLNISDGYLRDILVKNNVPLQVHIRVEVGKVYDHLTVIKELEPKYTTGGESKKMLLCECKCGKTVERTSSSLRKLNVIKSCGCHIQERKQKNEEIRINKKLEYEKKVKEWEIARIEKQNKPKEEHKSSKYVSGYKKDKLIIISVEGKHPNKFAEVLCECGIRKRINVSNLTQTKSCGCLQLERSSTHGHTSKSNPERRRWYDRWRGMIRRCYEPKMHAYPNYGGRGITVCDRWREPNGIGCQNYYEDIHIILGPQPSPEHSLDRIDNDGMYEISNLRWATNSQQSKNQRRWKPN